MLSFHSGRERIQYKREGRERVDVVLLVAQSPAKGLPEHLFILREKEDAVLEIMSGSLSTTQSWIGPFEVEARPQRSPRRSTKGYLDEASARLSN